MLALAGGKGGCGKTTATLGLARALEGPTLAVDADRDMPDLHAMAGRDRSPTLAAGIEAAQSLPGTPRTRLLSAPPATQDDATVATQLSSLRHETADEVLVDCPGGAGPDVAAPLSVADGVVLVSTPCAPAVRDAAKTAAMARALDAPVRGVVLSHARTAPEGLASFLECPVLGTVPPVEPPVLERPTVRDAFEDVAAALVDGSRDVTESHV